MLKSKKHVLWEALVITVVIFLAGLFLGMLIETSNSVKINNLFTQSEISMTDAMSVSGLIENSEFDCDSIKQSNINLANRIYKEAQTLEEYETSGKLTDSMELLHKKYDLLRTLLWIGNQKSLNRCGNYNLIIYLYEYNSEDTNKKAVQNVWSKVLFDIRNQNNNILLLPIAADQNLTSLNLMMEKYGVTKLPALVINNKKVIYKVNNVDQIQSLLN